VRRSKTRRGVQWRRGEEMSGGHGKVLGEGWCEKREARSKEDING
jgi:hypothetical protein